MKQIIPGAEPFYFKGGKIGCLLIHGHTATPAEIRWLGEYLHQQGHTVLGIRLSGHATQPEDMIRVRWQDWLADVESGWHLLRGITDKIFVIGLSLGGALTLTFSANFPVDGLVSMAAPYRLRFTGRDRVMMPLLPVLKHLIRFQKKGSGKWFNPEAVKSRIAYPVNPMNSALEVIRLLKYMRGELHKITAPVLLAHSKDDDYVLPDNLEKIRASLTTKDVRVHWVEQSNHIVTKDGDTRVLFNEVARFIRDKSA